MKILFRHIRDDRANAVIESVIVMPVILILIFSILLLAFSLHDRSTLEGAARRGAIYAAHGICDPNYDAIRNQSGGRGELDFPYGYSEFSFTGLGHNIKPYRYLTGSSSDLQEQVKAEVLAILDRTRIPWRELTTDSITYEKDGKHLFYVKVTVTIRGSYPIHELFSRIGLGSTFDFESSATVTVNDPDEFVRNADLAVDMIIEIDNRTGNHLGTLLEQAQDKLGQLCSRLGTWLEWLRL